MMMKGQVEMTSPVQVPVTFGIRVGNPQYEMLTHYYNIQTRGAAAMSLLCRMQDFALALPLLNPNRSLGCYCANEATCFLAS